MRSMPVARRASPLLRWRTISACTAYFAMLKPLKYPLTQQVLGLRGAVPGQGRAASAGNARQRCCHARGCQYQYQYRNGQGRRARLHPGHLACRASERRNAPRRPPVAGAAAPVPQLYPARARRPRGGAGGQPVHQQRLALWHRKPGGQRQRRRGRWRWSRAWCCR